MIDPSRTASTFLRILTHPTFILAVSIWLPLFIQFLPLSKQIDNSITDLLFRFWHRVSPADAAPELFFVPIDDDSVDPSHTFVDSSKNVLSNASLWNRDGWQTRRHWNLFLQALGDVYKPKVVAFDILIRQNTPSLPTQPPEEQTLHQIEAAGNREFQSHLINFEDIRKQGELAPQILFAYEFPDDPHVEGRLLADEQVQQAKWIKKLQPFLLPPGCVAAGATLPIYHSLHLPMKDILAAPGYNIAPINVNSDPDSVYRHIPVIYAFQVPGGPVQYTPSFALSAFLLFHDLSIRDLNAPDSGKLPSLFVVPGQYLALKTADGSWTIPIDQQLRATILPRFVFPKEIAKCSFVTLLDHATDPLYRDVLRDKLVVVGEGYTGGPDHGNLPLQPEVPRTLVHLQLLNNLFNNSFLAELNYLQCVLVCLVIALLTALLHYLISSNSGLYIHALFLPAYIGASVAFLVFGHIAFPWMAPTLLILFTLILHTYSYYTRAGEEREVLRRLFSTVTSPRVLQLLEQNPAGYYRSRKQPASIVFTDVEGFTSVSEKLDPDFLAGLINRYLTPMSDIIIQYDGYVDKYNGDGIMAIWGAPLEDPRHAIQACRACWYMHEAAQALKEKLPDGADYKFTVRMGINSGVVSAGNMGSAQKQQYTVMGDDVNLAARLEPTNKDYKTSIIMGPNTYPLAESAVHARKLDKIVVKGKRIAVLIYELIGLKEIAPDFPAWAVHYERGLDLLWARAWDEAETAFRTASSLRYGGDPASELQITRLSGYRVDPPPPEWQGEYVRLAKD